MKNTVLAAIVSLAFLGTGCLNENSLEPEIIVEPVFQMLVSSDTIKTGGHLGVKVNADAENVYTALQGIQETKKLQYVHVVGNVFSDLSQLDDRIHLYQSILLDEQKGTDSGIQISFQDGKVKSIYLNNGKQLSQWPSKENTLSSVRVGDQSSVLYSKLVRIKDKSSYANKFERISLFTKALASQYDPLMTQSPQWYFRYVIEPKLYEHVEIMMQDGKVNYLVVNRFKDTY